MNTTSRWFALPDKSEQDIEDKPQYGVTLLPIVDVTVTCAALPDLRLACVILDSCLDQLPGNNLHDLSKFNNERMSSANKKWAILTVF